MIWFKILLIIICLLDALNDVAHVGSRKIISPDYALASVIINTLLVIGILTLL